MKVAFVVEKFPVLSQTFIVDQITGLIDLGADVEIFAASHGDMDMPALNAKVHYTCDIPKAKLHRLKTTASLISRSLCKDPSRVTAFLMSMFKGGIATPLRQLCWIDQFYDKGFDVIFCHFGPVGSRAVALKRFGINSKLVTVFHGYDLSRYLVANGDDVYNELFKHGNMFLPISEFWKKKLIDIGCDENKIAVHHMGIDIDRFQFKERKLSPGEPVKLLTVGRLTEKKGHQFAIKALAGLAQKGLNFKYTIAGTGPQEEHLRSLVSQLGLQGKVTFAGPVSRDQAVRLYEQANIFVLTSVTADDGDQEGIPVVLMEAQACGLPVISTLHTGIPELVEDGHSGLLVPEKDVEQLTQKLTVLISSAGQWAEFGNVGKEIVHSRFNNKQLNKKLIQLLNDLSA